MFGLWFVLTVDYVHVQPSLLGMKKANRRVKTVASSIGVREHAHSRFTAQVGSPLHGSLNGPPLLLPGMYRPPHCTWQTPGTVQGHSSSFITLKEELLLPTPPSSPAKGPRSPTVSSEEEKAFQSQMLKAGTSRR